MIFLIYSSEAVPNLCVNYPVHMCFHFSMIGGPTRKADFVLTTTVTIWVRCDLGSSVQASTLWGREPRVTLSTSSLTAGCASPRRLRAARRRSGASPGGITSGSRWSQSTHHPCLDNNVREADTRGLTKHLIWTQKTVWRTKLNVTAKCFLLQSHEILWVASSHGI